MNMKVVMLFLLALTILAPASLALPMYLDSLNTVYGSGSCGTCHVNASSGGPRTSYGMSFENQPGHAANASAALIAIGAPPTTPIITPTITLTPEATATPTPAPIVTPAETQKTPGFGIIFTLAGLFAWALLGKRNN